ncbi:hypothetical protein [Azospirillum palustre]
MRWLMVDRNPVPSFDDAMRTRRENRKVRCCRGCGTLEQRPKTVSSCSKRSIRRPPSRRSAGPAALTTTFKKSTTQADR